MTIRLAVLVAALLLVAGCGDSDNAAEDEPTSSPSGSPSSSESSSESGSPSEPTTSASEPGGELTPPGTVLGLNEAATVLASDDKGVVAITPTSVKKAPAHEMRGQLAAGETGWYVWFEVVVVSTGKGGRIHPSDPNGNIEVMVGGNPAQLLPMADQKTCTYPFEPSNPKAGDSWRSCNPLKLDKGQVPEELIYTDPYTRYDRFDGKPVVWKLDL